MILRDFTKTDPIGLSSLVYLEDEDGKEKIYFLAPAGAGLQLQVASDEIHIVTPSSPLGKAMLGKYEGDDLEFQTPQKTREMMICTVS